MSDNDKVFAGSIPEIYDTYLVPLIFEGFAEDMAQRATRDSPNRVLETAAGSGVVTRALAPHLKASAQYVVTDLNQPMLDHAARQQGEDRRITWQQANALELLFCDDEFDAVCCQFGVMFFRMIRRSFWLARRMAIMTSISSAASLRKPVSVTSRSRPVTNSVVHHHPGTPPSPIARARLYAMRSKSAMQPN